MKYKTQDRRKILAIFSHGSILFSSTLLSLGIPLAIATIVMPIRAMAKIAKDPNRIDRYPLILRLF